MTTPCEQVLTSRFGEDVGTDRWWRRVAIEGCPIVSAIGRNRARVLFLWRDPEGDEAHSMTRRIYIDIPSVTDHHNGQLASLERIAGTDVWRWSFEVEADWRGSYSFIPVDDERLPPSEPGADDEVATRNSWRSAFKLAQTDSAESKPMSRRPARGSRFPQSICLSRHFKRNGETSTARTAPPPV